MTDAEQQRAQVRMNHTADLFGLCIQEWKEELERLSDNVAHGETIQFLSEAADIVKHVKASVVFIP